MFRRVIRLFYVTESSNRLKGVTRVCVCMCMRHNILSTRGGAGPESTQAVRGKGCLEIALKFNVFIHRQCSGAVK